MAKVGDLADILQQMSRLMEAQANAQKALLEQLVKPNDNEFLMETLSKPLPELSYDPQNGMVFDKRYARHQEVFTLCELYSTEDPTRSCVCGHSQNADDFVAYASAVNKSYEDFNVNTITADQFKCLIFVAGLHSEKNKDIRTRLLAKMENETAADPMTLKKLLLECQQMKNLKHDTAVIENPKAAVYAVCDAVRNHEAGRNRNYKWTSEKK
ncbi:uncharacterized protein LOC135707866 [Ochlerotatus camptorhynchus]|uniref:uncharacterized protein LOC135707866 n=1 Tax=Ochlerotatus camptorhynchus TaxID=644619 RepID=UPI0031DF101C